MLIITRRKGQRILIGDSIEIMVTATHRSSVKLAIRAPQHVLVLRAEVAAADDGGDEPEPDGGTPR
jgi:carbon storage regulator